MVMEADIIPWKEQYAQSQKTGVSPGSIVQEPNNLGKLLNHKYLTPRSHHPQDFINYKVLYISKESSLFG